MSGILVALGRLDFLVVLWLFPLVVVLHEAEEWNIVRWYERNYVDLPPMTNRSARIVLVLMSGAFLLSFARCTTLVLLLPNGCE